MNDPISKKILSGVLKNITLTDSSIPKRETYDPQTVEGTGVVVAEITRMEQPDHRLPDFFISISVMGQTFVSDDPDKSKIQQIFDDILKSVRNMTPGNLWVSTGLEVAGIFPDVQGEIRENPDSFVAAVDFKIAVCNLIL